MLVGLKVILDVHEEADEKVGCSDTSEENQNLLANEEPWRVTDAKEDGLVVVSRYVEEGMVR
jgi:hypothetical protein